MTAQAPDHSWGSDITSIRLRQRWLYVVAILDWFSRSVVRWTLADTLDLPFVLDAVGQALRTAPPQNGNTDHGSQFTSRQLTTPLDGAGVPISMDGTGRAHATSFTERVWRSRKDAEVDLADDGSPRAARHGIGRYFQFSTTERPQQALQYRRPVDLYHR